MSDHSTPGAVIARLAEIETDLANRMNEYETAASDRARLIRDWDKHFAIALKTAKGGDAGARKAAALVTAIETDKTYEQLQEAESAYEALKVVTKVLETRATIGMSILRAQGRA